MKLVSFTHRKRVSWGILNTHGVLDIPAIWAEAPPTLRGALEAGLVCINRVRQIGVDPAEWLLHSEVTLLAPILQPGKVIGLAVNYAEHHNEWDRGSKLPEAPVGTTTPRPFLMPASTVIGPRTTIPWPCYSEQIDYEVELAVVIGKETRRISPEEARGHIAGYSIANDISARSVTHAEGRTPREPKDGFFDWLHGKWADGFFPFGPCLVTTDEILDPMNLDLSLTVNGETRQQSNTSRMIFDVDRIVSFLSHLMTLQPGDVIATGTPSGVAMADGKWLEEGDVITARIEGIGELTNTLGPRPTSFYRPCADEA